MIGHTQNRSFLLFSHEYLQNDKSVFMESIIPTERMLCWLCLLPLSLCACDVSRLMYVCSLSSSSHYWTTAVFLWQQRTWRNSNLKINGQRSGEHIRKPLKKPGKSVGVSHCVVALSLIIGLCFFRLLMSVLTHSSCCGYIHCFVTSIISFHLYHCALPSSLCVRVTRHLQLEFKQLREIHHVSHLANVCGLYQSQRKCRWVHDCRCWGLQSLGLYCRVHGEYSNWFEAAAAAEEGKVKCLYHWDLTLLYHWDLTLYVMNCSCENIRQALSKKMEQTRMKLLMKLLIY